MRVSPPSPPLLATALAILAGVSGCGTSGYQYVANEDLGIYAKLPDDWAVYDETELFPDDTERQRDQRAEQAWLRSFDAATEPSAEASQSLGTDTPAGYVIVRALTQQEREQLDLSSLRGGGNPELDPIAAQSAQGGQSEVTVLSDDPVEYEGGFTGVHTVFVLDTPDGPVVIDQVTVRNAETTAIAVFRVSCSESCYFETHKDEIADVVDSWTIQEVRQ
jgi:hypothetical protein